MISEHLILEYELGFVATCQSRFDGTPKPVCPHQWGTLEADIWIDGVAAALDVLRTLDPESQPEVF